MNKPKILVPYIESGYGHIMAATAFNQALREKYGDKLEIIDTYIMREDNNPRLLGMEKFLTSATQATNKVPIFGKLIFPFIKVIGGIRIMYLVHKVIARKAFLATMEAFNKHNPDTIICPHYYLGMCAIEYKKRYDKNVNIVTYDPDANFFMWYDARDGWFVVNCDRAQKEALKRKIASDKIVKIPLPLRKDLVLCQTSKQECRKLFDVKDDEFLLTIADGAYMLGKAKSFAKYFLKKVKRPVTIILMTGHNEKNFKYFQKIQNKNPNVRLILAPFTKKPHEIYKASDLLMTKAGATVLQDAIGMQTPLLINYCPHAIEKANYEVYVRDYGCGTGAFTKRKALKSVYELMDNPKRLEHFKSNIIKLVNMPNGADNMADFIYSLHAEKK